jgi:methylenetetrahydrofolate dehydrogenase (NADP+) / methenyltetrahydrofolate cyclohydrolase
MTARIVDGTRIGQQIREEVAREVAELRQHGLVPGLATVLVGDKPASRVYVNSKIKACESLGIHSEPLHLPTGTTTEEVLDHIRRLNDMPEIDGILVQLPLPPQIDEQAVLWAVDPAKDVDGLHPMNAGKLALGREGLRPCTPSGVIEILRREKISMKGSHAVIIGRSNLVGKPQAFLLLQEHATVTLCHSRTRDLPSVTRQADILIAAMGRPAMVTAEYVKEGAVVIDVGTNRVEGEALLALLRADPSLALQYERNIAANRNYVLCGDVNFSSVSAVASALTPVPGGVGPLTIAMLMKNTLQAARMRRGRPAHSQ